MWVLCSMFWTGPAVAPLMPYLGFPIALLGGVYMGRRLRRLAVGVTLPATLALAAGVVLLAVPFYANAQAAWGLQLLSWAGLLALGLPDEGERRFRRGSIAVGMLALAAVLLVARAQATSVLAAPIAFLLLCAVIMRCGPDRATVGFVGLSTVGAAAATVIGLGSLPAWPETLSAGTSLSSVRHQLWADALDLWQAHPVAGAGPGAVLAHSDLAASDPTLERAHSSILQVGAELGTVGAVLFLAILVAGAAVALQGPRPTALIGVAAWSALGIHSMIDHLYEYPILTLTAGIVLGWAGRARPEGEEAPTSSVGKWSPSD